MLNKYKTEFEQMRDRVEQNENPLKVVNDYDHIFEKEGVGPLGVIHYLSRFIRNE